MRRTRRRRKHNKMKMKWQINLMVTTINGNELRRAKKIQTEKKNKTIEPRRAGSRTWRGHDDWMVGARLSKCDAKNTENFSYLHVLHVCKNKYLRFLLWPIFQTYERYVNISWFELVGEQSELFEKTSKLHLLASSCAAASLCGGYRNKQTENGQSG